jgi:Flp pilus assembly CpaF family ATPase
MLTGNIEGDACADLIIGETETRTFGCGVEQHTGRANPFGRQGIRLQGREVRGREAYDMIQAMHTGHPGSMSTGHGNSAADMLERLSLMLIMNSSIPWEACRRLVAQAVDLVVQLKRTSSGLRLISEVVSVDGIDNDNFTMTDLLEE